MDENIPPADADADDSELMDKFDGLVKKYRNQGKPMSVVKKTMHTHAAATGSSGDGTAASTLSGAIPVLTEVVTLRPSIIQPQPKRSTPVQKLLDSALEETGIAMNPRDRKALANALESRLAGKVIR